MEEIDALRSLARWIAENPATLQLAAALWIALVAYALYRGARRRKERKRRAALRADERKLRARQEARWEAERRAKRSGAPAAPPTDTQRDRI